MVVTLGKGSVNISAAILEIQINIVEVIIVNHLHISWDIFGIEASRDGCEVIIEVLGSTCGHVCNASMEFGPLFISCITLGF